MGDATSDEVLHSSITQPDHAILSVWDAGAPGFGAACHFSRIGPDGELANASLDVARHVLQPFRASAGEGRVFVASEAFAPLQCWSEGALQMSENALQRLGLEKPDWMSQETYEQALF